ncbi:MAG TPA: TIGR02530 family flagellar biosynthesis protein [Solirubrobacteraceae bacterium]|nr:TIGR02530 family flagellar biosynthesis protein [Solirubrobacteraceae bacterium]
MSAISNPALIPPGGVGSASAPAPVRPAAPAPQRGRGRGPADASGGPSFQDVLKDATATKDAAAVKDATAAKNAAGTSAAAAPLQFSRHALERVQRRGIDLSPSTLGRLQEGVGRAAGKGARDSVVLVDGTAFVVAVNNRTVITAVASEHMKDHVFTNIDSAVIA